MNTLKDIAIQQNTIPLHNWRWYEHSPLKLLGDCDYVLELRDYSKVRFRFHILGRLHADISISKFKEACFECGSDVMSGSGGIEIKSPQALCRYTRT